MKHMLITGANGFIGNAAASYFCGTYEVCGIDLAPRFRGEGIPVRYARCDLSQSPAALSAIIRDARPDVVIHCAGSANVGASVKDPMADLDGNLHSLYRLLIALRDEEIKPQIIFLSSAGVYGNPKRLPMRESDEAAPISPYGLHKWMCERLCEYYNRIYDFRIRTVRIFSAYGSGLRKQLLWDMFQKYRASGEIRLFGTGEETRDYIHVRDILRAIECVLVYGGPEEVFNVANGEEVSVRELAARFAAELGEDESIVSFSGEAKAGDPANWRADVSLLKKAGYEKSVTLQEGVADYVRWARGEEA